MQKNGTPSFRTEVEVEMDYMSFSKRVEEQPRLMKEMIERFGVDREALAAVDGGLAWFAACTKCIFCPEPKLCAQWLDDPSPPLRPADFCPNTDLFQDCQEGAPRRDADAADLA
jgi:hypothetical protein